MDIQYGNPANFHWLWLVPVAVGIAVAALVTVNRRRKRFATSNLTDRIFPATASWGAMLSTLLVTAALMFMTLAIVDIRWGKVWREVPQKGIEVMFVLDVSRSMLAEDVVVDLFSYMPANFVQRAAPSQGEVEDGGHVWQVGTLEAGASALLDVDYAEGPLDAKMAEQAGPTEQGGLDIQIRSSSSGKLAVTGLKQVSAPTTPCRCCLASELHIHACAQHCAWC